jgi:hypothetical protein
MSFSKTSSLERRVIIMRLMKLILWGVIGIFGGICLALAPEAGAQTIVLDFEGLQDMEPVNEFYNGGLGGAGSGPGPDYDISFSTNSLAIIDSDAGGSGNFGGEPSPDTCLFFVQGTAIMNVPSGFDTGFSLYYSSINVPGFVDVYDGLDATGNLLTTVNLPVTTSDGGDPTGAFSPLFPIGVSFNGVAKSVDFGGTVNQIGFDDITLGSATPGTQAQIPTLSQWGLIIFVILMGVSAIYVMRRHQTSC